jgi:hypothetical protein
MGGLVGFDILFAGRVAGEERMMVEALVTTTVRTWDTTTVFFQAFINRARTVGVRQSLRLRRYLPRTEPLSVVSIKNCANDCWESMTVALIWCCRRYFRGEDVRHCG